MRDEPLLDDVLRALKDMVDMTCRSMAPLWLDASRKAREKLAPESEALPEDVSPHLRKPLSNSSRSKYKALACWRHALVWQKLTDGEVPSDATAHLPDDEDIEAYAENAMAMEAIYFTRCDDTTPFSYSRDKLQSPALDQQDVTEDEIIRATVKATWASLQILEVLWRECAEAGPEDKLLYLGMKYKSLNDLLKFTDYRKKSPNSERYQKYEWIPPLKREQE